MNNVGLNEKFIFRVYKHLIANPAMAWVNTYEARSHVAISAPSDALDMLHSAASTLMAFERRLHLTGVRFDRVSISTWQADSKPYDPYAFAVQSAPAGANGQRETTFNQGPEAEPVALALVVRRVVTSGRQGRAFYRGVLSEGDITAVAGLPVLALPTAMQGELNTAVTATEGMSDMLGGGGTAGVQLCLINNAGAQIRDVQAFEVLGATIVKKDHKYFDRAPA